MSQRIELADNYTISRVLNGCWQLSKGHSLQTPLDLKDVMKAFHMLVERGFTTFDCADIYTGAEEFIGQFVKELKNGHGFSADDIQIHTKYVPDINLLSQVNYEFTEKIIDRSLMRLNRDTLDLVQFHWWDYDVPGCIETAGDLLRLKEKGKIRNIGVTNFDTDHLKELVDAGIPVISMQAQYSVFDRRPERKLIDYCKANDIKLLCYGTLSGGFLAEKWMGKSMAEPETRSQVKYLQIIEDTLGWDGYQELLKLLSEIAKKYSVSISNVATKYILCQSGVAGAIVGIRSSRHVESNSQIFKFELSEEDIAAIRGFLMQFPSPAGEPFQLERTVGSKYRSIMHMNITKEEQS